MAAPGSPGVLLRARALLRRRAHCVLASRRALHADLDGHQLPGDRGPGCTCLKATFPAANVLVLTYRPEVRIVQVSERSLAVAFPQHGPGKKHERSIRLTDWQLELTRRYPDALLKGLLHSDGSRCINRFRISLLEGRVGHYEYPRYFFTNFSADIRRIFCDHCELLGIRWTQSNPRNISVSHRDSVAILDGFVGPKR